MAITIRDFETMVSNVLSNISNRTGINNTNPGSVIRTISESILSENDIQYYQIQQLYNAMNIDSAVGADLDRLVSILGVVRKYATKCVGTVTFSRVDPLTYDIPIEYGQVISTAHDANGNIIEFIVSEDDAVLVAGDTSVDVQVTAVVAGRINIPIGVLRIMNTPIIGIESVSNATAIVGGTNDESDVDLRARVKQALNGLGKGTSSALESVVSNINGVLDTVVLDQSRGVGTSDIVVVTNVLPPSTELNAEILDAINDTKASGIDVNVVYPTVVSVDVSVTITVTTDYDIVAGAISEYFNTLKIGNTFIINQMERYILNKYDDNSVDISTVLPADNVSITGTQIIRVGTITINGEIYNG